MLTAKLKWFHFTFADVEPIVFSFRVKFFPADPFRLTGNSKILIYQQLKRDLIHGRLYCSVGEAAALGSLIVQGMHRHFFFKRNLKIAKENVFCVIKLLSDNHHPRWNSVLMKCCCIQVSFLSLWFTSFHFLVAFFVMVASFIMQNSSSSLRRALSTDLYSFSDDIHVYLSRGR